MKLNIKILQVTFIAFVFILLGCAFKSVHETSNNPWAEMEAILKNTTVPTFRNMDYSITDFGAVSDGKTDNTKAFVEAINKCNREGGGRVIVPVGKYKTSPIHLLSHVNLHLVEGAEIIFTNEIDEFPIVHTSYEGIEIMNFSPLIYAYQQENIAVTGRGILNGGADKNNWWPWCGKKEYGWKQGDGNQSSSLDYLKEELIPQNTPVEKRVFGKGQYLRPTFIEPFECKNVLIQGVTIIQAPFWVIHPIKSENVIVDGVQVTSHGPNNDGCDPEYSKNVIIKNCTFNTGDDCIAIKSGRNEDGRRVNIPSENIVIQNCKMVDGHGGVVIGSEISAGVRNVYVQNCEMDSPHLERAIRIKSNSKRGGFVENLYIRNIKVGNVSEAFLKINLFYGTYANQSGDFIPRVNNIYIENTKVRNAGKYGILAKGHKEFPITKITLKNVIIDKAVTAFEIENVNELTMINSEINGTKYKSFKN